jgi:hypothetical protein
MMSEEEQAKAALIWMRAQAKAIDNKVDESYSVSYLTRIITFNVSKETIEHKIILLKM